MTLTAASLVVVNPTWIWMQAVIVVLVLALLGFFSRGVW
jgi:hypothetical protein